MSHPLRLDAGGQQILRAALAVARERRHRRLCPVHLLAALVDAQPPPEGVQELPQLRDKVDGLLDGLEQVSEDGLHVQPRTDAATLSVLHRASEVALDQGRVSVADIAAALADDPGPAGRLLAASSGGAAEPAPVEAPYALDLTAAARRRDLPSTPSRTATVDRVLRIVGGRHAPHALLVGGRDVDPPGVLAALGRRLVDGPVPAALRGAVLVSLDVPRLAGDHLGAEAVARRLRATLEALTGAGPSPVIAFAGDLGVLLRAEPAAVVLLAAMEQGTIRFVGAVSDTEHAALFGANASGAGASLAARMRRVTVDEPEPPEALEILGAEAGGYDRDLGVDVGAEALEAAVQLARRYLPDRRLPGSARDLLDEAAAGRSSVGGSTPGSRTVRAADVAAVVSDRTGVPVSGLVISQNERLSQLEGRLAARVVGQDRAIGLVSAAIRRAYAGIADPDRPLGSFLFLGPTGVGKTELAATLSAEVLADERALVRLDMGEYQEAHSVARLVGAPPGYVGYGREGELAGRLRRDPHAVVLLDEIEKAHADIFNVLLSVLEEGRLTDGQGATVDARHTIIVMTSNLGSHHILDEDLERAEIEARVLAEARRVLRPEYLNRIDEVVIFNRLTPADLHAIVDIQLGRLQDRLHEHRLRLEVDQRARDWLVRHGYYPVYGARPLRRVLRRSLEDQIARAILSGVGGGTTLAVSVGDDDTLTVRPAPPSG